MIHDEVQYQLNYADKKTDKIEIIKKYLRHSDRNMKFKVTFLQIGDEKMEA